MKTTKFSNYVRGFFIALLVFSGSVYSEEDENKKGANSSDSLSLAEQVKNIDVQVDPAAWNIRNGCVVLRRIKRIKFVDDQTALMSMHGKNQGRNKIILRLRRECPGIRNNGFVHRTTGLRLCAGFDRFSTMGSGFSCRVESLEPYIDIEEPQGKITLD